MDKMIGKKFGKYAIESLIGEGQMTAVYRAVEDSNNKTVAVKIFHPKLKIDPEIVKRFKAEVGLLSAIYHPSKMKIHGFGEQDGIFYLVMDYLPGGDLEDRLGTPMPVEDATDIMLKIVRALEESNAIGVIHGNIKPSNILFSGTGTPVITDFKINSIQHDLDPMLYMAPEAESGEKATTQADQYALGEIYYEMLTGRRPFEADSDAELSKRKAEEAIPDPRDFVSDLPTNMAKILYTLLNKDVSERYASIGKFREALDSWNEEPSIEIDSSVDEMKEEGTCHEEERQEIPITWEVTNNQSEAPADKIVGELGNGVQKESFFVDEGENDPRTDVSKGEKVIAGQKTENDETSQSTDLEASKTLVVEETGNGIIQKFDEEQPGEMKYSLEVCPKCGRKLPEEARFCPYCSINLQKVIENGGVIEENKKVSFALIQEKISGFVQSLNLPASWKKIQDIAGKTWVWLREKAKVICPLIREYARITWDWLRVGNRRWFALGAVGLVFAGILAIILYLFSLIGGKSSDTMDWRGWGERRVVFSPFEDMFAIVDEGELDVFENLGRTGLLHMELTDERGIALLPENRTAILDSDGVIRIINLEDKIIEEEIKTRIQDAEQLLTLDDGRLAVVDLDGKTVTIWTGGGEGEAFNEKVKPSKSMIKLTASPQTWALSGDAVWLSTVKENGILQVWDLNEETAIFTGYLAEAEKISMAFDPSGDILALSSQEGLRVFALPSGEMVWGHTVCKHSPMAFSADGSRIACVEEEVMLVLSVGSGEMLEKLELPYQLTDMTFNQKTGTLFTVYETGSVEYLKLKSSDATSLLDDEAAANSPDAMSAETINAATTAIVRPTKSPTPEPVEEIEPIDLKVNPVDGVEIVFVPAGEFTMGSESAIDPYFWGAEAPQHEVMVHDFWIYRTEVTNKQYADCVEAKACPLPHQFILWDVDTYYGNSQYDDFPVLYVNWTDAQSYCRYVGGRLPYEAEWEKAARGTDGRMFPWGDDLPGNTLANLCDRNCPESDKNSDVDDGYRLTSPVGSFPKGASPYGVYDMAGNAWEWVFDYFSETYYVNSPYDNPIGPGSSKWRVIRGGAYIKTIGGLRTAVRYAIKPDVSLNTVGFRCVIENPDY